MTHFVSTLVYADSTQLTPAMMHAKQYAYRLKPDCAANLLQSINRTSVRQIAVCLVLGACQELPALTTYGVVANQRGLADLTS